MPWKIILEMNPSESVLLKQKVVFPPGIMNCFVCSSLIEPNGRVMPPKWNYSHYTKLKLVTNLFFLWHPSTDISIWQQLVKNLTQTTNLTIKILF